MKNSSSMNEWSNLTRIVVPLYNVKCKESFTLSFSLPEFVHKLTFHFRNKSIPPISAKDVTITINLFPWKDTEHDSVDLLSNYGLRYPGDLPENFDIFEHWRATSLLVIDTLEFFPAHTGRNILSQSSQSPYGSNCVSSFLTSLKLFDNSQPHYYRGFHFRGQNKPGVETHWPLKEMHGSPIEISQSNFTDIIKLFFSVWRWKAGSVGSNRPQGHRVLDLACSYYLLASTQTEYEIIFLFLMIAFEALFKRGDERSVTKARSRFAKLIAKTKAEYSQISLFMSENPKDYGCCYLRNVIVHGDIRVSSINNETYWQLENYIRRGLLQILHLICNSDFDSDNYYDSLDRHVESRFRKLPSL